MGPEPERDEAPQIEVVPYGLSTTFVPAAYFDALAASLDDPDDAPGLAQAVRLAARRKRITPR